MFIFRKMGSRWVCYNALTLLFSSHLVISFKVCSTSSVISSRLTKALAVKAMATSPAPSTFGIAELSRFYDIFAPPLAFSRREFDEYAAQHEVEAAYLTAPPVANALLNIFKLAGNMPAVLELFDISDLQGSLLYRDMYEEGAVTRALSTHASLQDKWSLEILQGNHGNKVCIQGGYKETFINLKYALPTVGISAKRQEFLLTCKLLPRHIHYKLQGDGRDRSNVNMEWLEIGMLGGELAAHCEEKDSGSFFPYNRPLKLIAAHDPTELTRKGNIMVFEVDDDHACPRPCMGPIQASTELQDFQDLG